MKKPRQTMKIIAHAKCNCSEQCGMVEFVMGKKVFGFWCLSVQTPNGEFPIDSKLLSNLDEVRDFLKRKYYGTHVLKFF